MRVADNTGAGFQHPPASILVTNAVFHRASDAAAAGFLGSSLDARLVLGVHLFEGRRILQFLGGVAQDPLVGEAVVEAPAIYIHNGDEVGGIFADESKKFFSADQLPTNP